MNSHLDEMIMIMCEETTLFEQVCLLEERKTGAIMAHDGRSLDGLSREQEGLLGTIASLESRRIRHANQYARGAGLSGHATLGEIAACAEAGPASRLKEMGRSLRAVLVKLKGMQETNRVLINDNMEYYNILLTGLRRSRTADAGYGQDGREDEKLKNSILFNTTA